LRLQRVIKFLGLYVAISIFAAVVLLIYVFSHYPKSIVGWVLFFVLALPIAIIGEAIGEAIWRNPVARKLERLTSDRSLSWLRICYGFIAILLLSGLVWAIIVIFGGQA
jgi:hypothetical protein